MKAHFKSQFKSRFKSESNLIRYGIATLGALVAIASQYFLGSLFGSSAAGGLAVGSVVGSAVGASPTTSFLFIYPACFAVMAIAGFGPACVSILLAICGEEILLQGSMSEGRPAILQLTVALFGLFSLLIVWIFDRNQRADSSDARRSADLELAQSRKQMQIITDSLPVPVYYVDLNFRYQFVNASLLKWAGLNKRDFIGKTIATKMGSEYFKERRPLYEKVLSGQLVKVAEQATHSELGLRDVNTMMVPDFDEQGKVRGFVVLLNDLTDEVRSQKQLFESQKKIRDYIEAMPTMAFIADGQGHVSYFNKRWLDYSGMEFKDYYGWAWDQLLHPSHLQRTIETWRESVRTGQPFQIEYMIRRKDGVYRWALGRATPVRDASGKITEWYGNNTDIHDLKIAQEELLLAKEKAEQANSLKSTFLANMSHEIRTPMTAVLGFTEILREPDLPERLRQDALARIDRSGHALLRLIDDILDISKIEAGKISLERARFSPADLLDDVVAMLSLQAEQKGIGLQMHVEAGVPDFVHSDPARVRQVLTNIIGNAVKFTSHGAVVIRLRASEQRYLSFQVQDSGIGISEADQLKLFKPFAQADESITRQFGGTGLGLVLSKRLCQQMGGDLTLEKSEPGRGSLFQIKIDGAPFELRRDGFAESPSELAQTTHGKISHFDHDALAGKHLLLAEDIADNQVLMRRYLESVGASVEIASNGEEALTKARGGHYDLILMDIQMPQMDGIQAVQHLREEGYSGPVLALTAHAMSEEIGRSLAAGFDDHLTKPISKDRLISAVQEHAL